VLPEVDGLCRLAESAVGRGGRGGGGGIAFLKEQQWADPFDVIAGAGAGVTARCRARRDRGARRRPGAGERAGDGIAPRRRTGRRRRSGSGSGGAGARGARARPPRRAASPSPRPAWSGSSGRSSGPSGSTPPAPSRSGALEEARHDLEVARRSRGHGRRVAPMGDYHAPAPGAHLRGRRPRTSCRADGSRRGPRCSPSSIRRTAWLRVQVPWRRRGVHPGAPATFTVEGSTGRETEPARLGGQRLDPADAHRAGRLRGRRRGRLTFGQLARPPCPRAAPSRRRDPELGHRRRQRHAGGLRADGGESFERRVLTLGATDGACTHVSEPGSEPARWW
jgi:hypothetical protein